MVRFEVCDFRSAPPSPADLVIANLTGGMLRTTARTLVSLKQPGGALIVSGFDHAEVDAVRAAFDDLTETERLEEASWMALRLA